jgi:hypothetical protein
MGRTSVSLKRMALPAAVAMKISPCPSERPAPSTSSPGSSASAMMPAARGLAKAVKGVFLM